MTRLTWLILALTLLPAALMAAEVRLAGINLIKQTEGMAADPPEVTLPEGWELYRQSHPDYGEMYCAENPHEFFFHVRVPDGAQQPARARVRWPGVEIKRVIAGDRDLDFQRTAEGIEFDLPLSTGNTTQIATVINDPPGMQMILMHHLEARRAGPYATGPWPDIQIRAHLNFLFAAREALSRLGLLAADRGFDERLGLYGFESNFPRGHVDHPPHFHILFIPEKWDDVQVTHFRLDEKGRTVVNDWQCRAEHRKYGPGEVCSHKLADGTVVLEMVVTQAGGLTLRRPGVAGEYTLAPDARSGVGSAAVELLCDGEPVLRVSVDDDASTGNLLVRLEPLGADAPAPTTERVLYDPDTGAPR